MTEHAEMEIDFRDLHRMMEEETDDARPAGEKDPRAGSVIYMLLKNILIGSTVLLVLAGLSLFLIDNIEEHVISKADITVIKYQLSQIDERLQEIERETGSSRVLLMGQIDQVTKRTDALDGKMDSLNRGGSETLPLDQVNRIVARIDQLTLKIDALSARSEALAQDRYHHVTRGESLRKIAQRYGLEKEDLCRLNGITANHDIHPGDRLMIR